MDHVSTVAQSAQVAGVVGGALVSHAPQFLSLPETEDKAQVARVRVAMEAVGAGLRALKPDLVMVVSNCHGEEMSVHCAPSFMLHCGDRAQGAGKHSGTWRIDGEAGSALVRELMEEGFDPAFTFDAEVWTPFTISYEFCGFSREQPFLPVFVNAYVPPQPSPERCFNFGKALARSVARIGRRAVIIAGGGLSHYPGTALYPTPDVETDRATFEHLAAGNLRYVMSFDPTRLDRTGNVELRGCQILAGALGPERKPDVAVFEPSWHHVHATVAWTTPLEAETYVPLYPGFTTRHSQLARAIYAIVTDGQARSAYMADRSAFAGRFELHPDEAGALARLDEDELRQHYSINTMLVYQAKLSVGAPLKHRTPK